MPYIGKNLVGILKDARASDIMTGDGSDTTLTLTDTPGSTNNVLVFLDGIRQTPVTDYTVMGRTLTFTTAPEAGVLVVALTGSASSIDPKMGSVTSSKIVDGMVGDAKIAGMAASKLTGALPAISGANLTNVATTGIDNVTSDPTISTNPSGGVGTIHLNQNSGEMFVCIDATAGANEWINVGHGTGDIEPWIFQGTIAGYTQGGNNGSSNDIIDKWSFVSDANATDVGDLTVARHFPAGQCSATHGYTSGGRTSPDLNVIDKFSYASDGDATDSGDLTVPRGYAPGQSSTTHGYLAGGNNGPVTNVIDRFSTSTGGNATDVGDLTSARGQMSSQSSETHGYVVGGQPANNVIERFSFAASANGADVGDCTANKTHTAGQSSITHGYFSGNHPHSNVIERFTFAASANSSDVGDMTVARNNPAGSSSTTHGYTAGGHDGGHTNVIDKFAFSASANATDVGDLSVARGILAGTQV